MRDEEWKQEVCSAAGAHAATKQRVQLTNSRERGRVSAPRSSFQNGRFHHIWWQNETIIQVLQRRRRRRSRGPLNPLMSCKHSASTQHLSNDWINSTPQQLGSSLFRGAVARPRPPVPTSHLVLCRYLQNRRLGLHLSVAPRSCCFILICSLSCAACRLVLNMLWMKLIVNIFPLNILQNLLYFSALLLWDMFFYRMYLPPLALQ